MLNFEYAEQIARDRNAQSPPYAGFVTKFDVEQTYAEQFEVHTVGKIEAIAWYDGKQFGGEVRESQT